MSAILTIVIVAFAIEIVRHRVSLLRRGSLAHVRSKLSCAALRLVFARFCSSSKAFLDAIDLTPAESFATYFTGVEKGKRGTCFEALVGLECLEGIAATSADTQRAETIRINAWELGAGYPAAR